MDIAGISSETCQQCVQHFEQKQTRFKEEIKHLQNELQRANETIEEYKLEIERLRSMQADFELEPMCTEHEPPEENNEMIIGNELPPSPSKHIKAEPEEVIFHIEELLEDPLMYSETSEHNLGSDETSSSPSIASSSCRVCKRTFETYDQLNCHLDDCSMKWYLLNPNGKNSIQTGDHTLFCHEPACGLSMQSQAHLTDHMWMHIGLPYKCLTCSMTFSQFDIAACQHKDKCTITRQKWKPDETFQEVEYKMMQGFRRNRRLLYSITEKQFYTRNKELKNRLLFYCSVRTCKSRLIMCEDNVCIKLPNFIEHNHPPRGDMYNQLVVRNKLIEEVQNVQDSNGSELESLNSIYTKNVSTSSHGYVLLPDLHFTSNCGNNSSQFFLSLTEIHN